MAEANKGLGFAGVAADLAGLATIIGTAVPGLKKAKKRDTSKRAVRSAGLATAAGAVGASQSGHAPTRALALREGLRAAAQSNVRGADAASTAAAQDEQRFVEERDARNARLSKFGAGLGDMAANIAGGIVDTKALKAAEAEEAGVVPEAAEGIGEEAALAEQEAVGAEPQQLDVPPLLGDGPIMEDALVEGQHADTMNLVDAPPVTAQDAYRQSLGLPSKPVLSLAPQLEQKLRLSNLIVEEADRMGVVTTSILAQALRSANIPTDLGSIAPGYEGEHADVMSQVDGDN